VLTRLLVALVVLMPAACATDSSPPREITGVVVEIDSRGLGRLRRFTVKDGDRRYAIYVDDSTRFAFTPSHLQEHRATGAPVAVEVEDRGDKLFALSVRDG
jgi:hypothetical protein